ncbi:MAG: radical SAM protein [Desulfobacterales bacterium SG8_35_2]|jgi:putative pyruvate formate lyase activating enzyme|nr:MAG: radical SAM protein [Desulfobacterales bacterium SG8_35_2]
MTQSGYLALHAQGKLAVRIAQARELLSPCKVCPRQCKVDRLADEKGICRTGASPVVSSYAPHFGEESPLVGSGGSGTIFLTHCNLLCVFCQNYEISHLGQGIETDAGQLASMMVSLQRQGCHNINFVTPSHVVPQILEALPKAIARGLTVPLVYNSSGYDAVETLQLLEGIFDIYMPDFKFWTEESGRRYAKAPDYPEIARRAILEMHRQVGDLVMDKEGVAIKGLLVRHLVMPGGLDETREILRFLAREVSVETYVNVMDQYRPCGRAHQYPPIDRRLTNEEFQEALKLAGEAGLKRLDEKDWLRILRKLGIR